MIIKALKEFYDRKSSDSESKIAPPGWIAQGIDFVIVLDAVGGFVQVDSMQERYDGKLKRFPCLVPNIGKQALKHTNSGIDANLLWDNSGFVLGQGDKGARKLESFIATIEHWLNDVNDMGVSAVLTFLKAGVRLPSKFDPIIKHPQFGEEIRSGRSNIAFRIVNDSYRFVFDHPAVRTAVGQIVETSAQANPQRGICLISGEREQPIALCHPVIKKVWGAQTSGATIVGINKDKPAFNSFGKEQGANSPVCESVVAAYTKALNYLLDSKQRMQVGDSSTVFWSDKITNFEQEVVDFFGEPPKDDPARNTRAVESLFKAVHTGSMPNDEGASKFYVLGLAPNASRIAIRFWIVDTVAGMADKICRHFEDTKIVPDSRDKNTPSLFRLLVSTATQGKAENIPPHIAGETMRAILEGLPYPRTLLQVTIRRIRAEQSKKDKRTGKALPHVTYERAALIKACINRSTRFKNHEQQEEIQVSLDINNTNIGYRLGRLFATLEKIQQEASPGLNATIRDRFYGAASSTPVTVFGNLMRLKNHHLAKLERAGRRVFFEKLLGQIIDGFGDFPSHLKLDDQGRFAIGYYHQVQDFYTKKSQ